jgi:hypothetical protein
MTQKVLDPAAAANYWSVEVHTAQLRSARRRWQQPRDCAVRRLSSMMIELFCYKIIFDVLKLIVEEFHIYKPILRCHRNRAFRRLLE